MAHPSSILCPDCGTWNQEPSEDTMYRCWKCRHDFLPGDKLVDDNEKSEASFEASCKRLHKTLVSLIDERVAEALKGHQPDNIAAFEFYPNGSLMRVEYK